MASIVPALLQLEHLCLRQTADWYYSAAYANLSIICISHYPFQKDVEEGG